MLLVDSCSRNGAQGSDMTVSAGVFETRKVVRGLSCVFEVPTDAQISIRTTSFLDNQEKQAEKPYNRTRRFLEVHRIL
jgi:hypothetical protein